jgi:hypothetical protein
MINLLRTVRICAATAHADRLKMEILAETIRSLASIQINIDFFILTNIDTSTYELALRDMVGELGSNFSFELINNGYANLESPWLLTWCHKDLMRSKYESGRYTHFLYLEDDMKFTTSNLHYWLRDRELLRATPFYPSFLRIEKSNKQGTWTLVDFVLGDEFSLGSLPRVDVGDGRVFVSMPRPYQGMFLYDRTLMQEHVNGEMYSLDLAVPDWRSRILHTDWPLGLTEAANIGISRTSVPHGFYSRNLVPIYNHTKLIDPSCFIHHSPNKYANSPGNIGKIPFHALITS